MSDYELKEKLDIHRLVDDAMDKKDRIVSIYINDIGMSVNVTPLDGDENKWTANKIKCGNKIYSASYICPECFRVSDKATLYCPHCGVQLKGVKNPKDIEDQEHV